MQQKNRLRSLQILILFLGFGLFTFVLVSFTKPAQAAPSLWENKSSNDTCLSCHKEQDIKVELNGQSLSATIDPAQFELSAHAQEDIECVDCHANIKGYPHKKIQEKTIRAHSKTLTNACKECHEEQFAKAHDSTHQLAFESGNENAAICSDCHNPHSAPLFSRNEKGEITNASVQKLVRETCSKCHAEIYGKYQESVHGKSLIEEGNADAPICTDCHGVHNVLGGTTSFHNSTPALCAKCHADAEIMNKYDISTNVINSYVADFHGTTVNIFEQQFSDQPTNKAVCTDCHGVHDITKTNDPATGITIQENLLVKCQRCHPDANANFSAAWMSHYEPSPEHYPIVYYVNLFYKFFIPIVLGSMVLFVLTDIYRSLLIFRRASSIESKEENNHE